jgi:hypothetical protein
MTDIALPITLPVLTFARIAFDHSENTAYAAARKGDFPTIRVSGSIKVPVRVALAKLAGGDPATLEAMTRDFAAKLKQIEDQAA